MNDIFAPVLRKYVLVFFDDILIYSHDVESHCKHLSRVLLILRNHELYAKRSKCAFALHHETTLVTLSVEMVVATDSIGISAMLDWPIPKNIKQLRGFLGLTGYFRRFIDNYGVIAGPLSDLTRKGGFKWNEQAESAFKLLKQHMVEAPFLSLPDFTKAFVIETGVCQSGIGAMLMHDGKPISYFSQALCPRNQALSTYEKELLAILTAVSKWSNYLVGSKFIIRMDHASLKFLKEQKIVYSLQQKWLYKLLGYDFVIEYKQGKHNLAADALYRKFEQSPSEEDQGTCALLTQIQPQWVSEIISSYQGDTEVAALLAGAIQEKVIILW